MLNFGGVTDEDLQIIIFRLHPQEAKTKLYPLVGRESYTWIILKTSHFGILYMDHPKDQPLCLVLDFKGMINPLGILGAPSHLVSG